jgi:hypothetical protein
MKIVQGDEQPIVTGRNTRAGQLNKQSLLTGDEGSLGNFVFGLYSQTGDFSSPRHHHNFSQWRYQIDGECDLGKNGVMKPGMLAHVPEGAYYGPQSSNQPNTVALIQFGGPTGHGYMSQDQVYRAFEEMQAIGHVENGVFYRNDGVPGKKTMDSFEATWEFATQRPMLYPPPQYAEPIVLDTANFRWMPLDGVPGVEEKAYGTFTDCKIPSAGYKLDPGATFTATGRGIYFVLSGSGLLEGGPFRRFTGLLLERRETATFRADETSEILLLGLPEIARMRVAPLAGEVAAKTGELAKA